jgi:gluconolactonase
MKIKMMAMCLIVFASLVCVSASGIAQETAESTQEKSTEKKVEEKAGEKTETAAADEKKAEAKSPAPTVFTIAKENIQFTAIGEWKSVPPKSNMLEAEFQIPKTGNDVKDGRLTIMRASGSNEANIARWQGQFKQEDGSTTASKTKTSKETIAEQTVHFVSITGTYLDSVGGPFSGTPKVERKDYRMMATIIETADFGKVFVKLYGPKSMIDKNEKSFKALIKSMKFAE